MLIFPAKTADAHERGRLQYRNADSNAADALIAVSTLTIADVEQGLVKNSLDEAVAEKAQREPVGPDRLGVRHTLLSFETYRAIVDERAISDHVAFYWDIGRFELALAIEMSGALFDNLTRTS